MNSEGALGAAVAAGILGIMGWIAGNLPFAVFAFIFAAGAAGVALYLATNEDEK